VLVELGVVEQRYRAVLEILDEGQQGDQRVFRRWAEPSRDQDGAEFVAV
jgi:hypothetical protein